MRSLTLLLMVAAACSPRKEVDPSVNALLPEQSGITIWSSERELPKGQLLARVTSVMAEPIVGGLIVVATGEAGKGGAYNLDLEYQYSEDETGYLHLTGLHDISMPATSPTFPVTVGTRLSRAAVAGLTQLTVVARENRMQVAIPPEVVVLDGMGFGAGFSD